MKVGEIWKLKESVTDDLIELLKVQITSLRYNPIYGEDWVTADIVEYKISEQAEQDAKNVYLADFFLSEDIHMSRSDFLDSYEKDYSAPL